MDGQGLQAIRSEIEAIVALQAALNRLALWGDENALTEWGGPRPDEIDGLVRDDGSIYRNELIDLRKRAGDALATRFREVAAVTQARPELHALLGRVLSTGTGGVASLKGPEAGGVLAALTRTGAIRLDWAEAAAAQVRDELEKLGTASKPRPSAPRAPAKTQKKKAPAPKKKAPKKTTATKKPAARKAPVKKKAASKKAQARKPSAKQPSAKKPAASAPIPKKKR
jgi:hypothetical protein